MVMQRLTINVYGKKKKKKMMIFNQISIQNVLEWIHQRILELAGQKNSPSIILIFILI
jgi:site-specific recombinase XerD